MLYRLALTSGLMLTCLAATTTVTLAESTSVEVQFSGTVPERTSISIPTNQSGESLSSSSFKAITSLSFANAPPSFTNPSSKLGHSITNLRFNSTRSNNIIISPPQFVSGSHPEPKGTNHSSSLKFATDTHSIDIPNGTIPPGETDLQLQTLVKAPQNFPPGTYNYTTTLTIVP